MTANAEQRPVNRGEATVRDIQGSSRTYDNHCFAGPVWRQALAGS
ncbi:hypothetical protein ACPA54_04940 [Uniformispora flossi]